MNLCKFHLPGYFITGTDTDVGKTYVTSLIAKQLTQNKIKFGLYKPACSGAELIEKNCSDKNSVDQFYWNDVEILWNSLNGKYDRNHICSQCFQASVAPPIAAKLENKKVDSQLIYSGLQWWQDQVDFLLIEGVGGLLAPLSDTETVADFAVNVNSPLIIVARLGLGTINHTLLTIEAALSRGLEIAGIILNENEPSHSDISRLTNPNEIEKKTNIPILGIVNYNGSEIVSVENGSPVNLDWVNLNKEV